MIRLTIARLRQTWIVASLVALGLFGFQFLAVFISTTMGSGQSALLGRSLPKGLQSFLGLDRLPLNSLTGFLSVAWQHPFMLAAAFIVPLSVASRLLAGEVERRTMALLLSRPVSRAGIVLSAGLVIVLESLVVVGAAAGGTWIGSHMLKVTGPPSDVMLFNVAANLYLLMLAAGGLALAFSAWSSEQSDALGWAVTVMLIMYVWSFLTQVWPAVHQYAPYTLFHYYPATQLFQNGNPLLWNYELLGLVATAGLLYALLVYQVRDFNV